MVTKDAADTVKRVTLELGGKSPNLVFADLGAQLRERVEASIGEVMYNTGQTCDAPTRLLVERSCYEEVLAIATEVGAATQVGNPAEEGDHLGPLVSSVQYGRVQECIRVGIEEDQARLLCGGMGKPEGFEQGFFTKPTIFADVHNQMRIAREEIFGPVLVIIPFDSEAEALAIANDTPYGLSSYLQTGDAARAERVAARLRAGAVHVNGGEFQYGSPFGAPQSLLAGTCHSLTWHGAVGGYKQSGNGREGGMWGLDDYQEHKVLHMGKL
jgi:aldehyde dehydrogenase (NAD+)